MARAEAQRMKSATIVASGTLLDRVTFHVSRDSSDNKTAFFHRAIVNQLEKEGDDEIREILEAEKEEV